MGALVTEQAYCWSAWMNNYIPHERWMLVLIHAQIWVSETFVGLIYVPIQAYLLS